jgi:hypothetical protein
MTSDIFTTTNGTLEGRLRKIISTSPEGVREETQTKAALFAFTYLLASILACHCAAVI